MFETDEQALLALDQIRGKEIDGHAIHARIKTENILKAFTHGLTHQHTPPFVPPTSYGRGYNPNWQQQQPDQNMGRGYRGNNPKEYTRGPKQNNSGKGQQQNNKRKEGGQVSPSNTQQKKGPRDQAQSQQDKRPKSGKPRTSQDQPSTAQQQPTNDQQQQQQQPSASTDDGRSVGRGKRRPSFTRAHPPPSLASVKNFPPLPQISKADLLKSGYENDKYLSYPKGAIISVYVNNLKNLQRPSDMPTDCPAVLSQPKTQLELTKPPLPHHEVQQHPEHVEEIERSQEQEQQEYLQQLESTTTPQKKNSTTSNQQTQPLHPQQNAQSSSASSNITHEVPNVTKSFAEAAITAKDIKSPDFPRVEQPKRRNSIKGGKPKGNEQESAQQAPQQKDQKEQKGRGRGRRNSLEGGRRRRNSIEGKDGASSSNSKPNKNNQQKDGLKAPKQSESGSKSDDGRPSTVPSDKPKRNRNKNNKKPSGAGSEEVKTQAPQQQQQQAQDSSVNPPSGDNKSYASIVNKVKETSPSPKVVEHPSSPKTTDSTAQQGKNTSK